MTVRLVCHTSGKSPTSDGLKVFNRLQDLPQTEEICHYVLPLQHISGTEEANLLPQMVALHPYGALTSIADGAALIITENSTTIRSICELARLVDSPPTKIENDMIKVEHASLDAIADIIRKIYEPGEDEPRARGAVKVIPYRRTNELLVMGRPGDLAGIKALVRKLDQQDGSTFIKRHLKRIKVRDFLRVAQNALSRDTDITAGSGATHSARRNSLGAGSATVPAPEMQSDAAPQISGADGSPDAGAPDSRIVGRTLLVAEPESNSLIFSGAPQHLALMDRLIHEMDVRPQQAYISAVIGQLVLGRDYDHGFDFLKALDDFSIRRPGDSRSSASSSGSISDDTLNTAGVQFPANLAGTAWNQFSLYGQIGSLGRHIRLIDGNKNFKVLATPSVYAKNGVKAFISSGQRIAVPAQILSNGAAQTGPASSSVSVEYREVQLKFEVTPLVNSDNEVTLRIVQINDNVQGSQTISGNAVPTIGSLQVVTEVAVANSATIVLGGLITERVGTQERGAVFLRRIPLIRHAFGTASQESSREELLIFIQPHIVSAEQPDAPNRFESERASLFREARQFGSSHTDDIPKAQPIGARLPTSEPRPTKLKEPR